MASCSAQNDAVGNNVFRSDEISVVRVKNCLEMKELEEVNCEVTHYFRKFNY